MAKNLWEDALAEVQGREVEAPDPAPAPAPKFKWATLLPSWKMVVATAVASLLFGVVVILLLAPAVPGPAVAINSAAANVLCPMPDALVFKGDECG